MPLPPAGKTWMSGKSDKMRQYGLDWSCFEKHQICILFSTMYEKYLGYIGKKLHLSFQTVKNNQIWVTYGHTKKSHISVTFACSVNAALLKQGCQIISGSQHSKLKGQSLSIFTEFFFNVLSIQPSISSATY